MTVKRLFKDPYNIIIAGVGGQGNVMASRMLSNILVHKGYNITIGETFGASQRGGSVMSHIRVSSLSSWSPQMPKGKADVVVTLEPIEAIRVLAGYGNPAVKVLTNTRAIYPAGVIAGNLSYPTFDEIRETLKKLSSRVWFIDATDEAVKLGNSILGNIIMIGALSTVDDLPVGRDDFKEILSRILPAEKMDDNLKAFDLGVAMMKK
ncbi:MAG: indolepyruvate oxidoreductase subunit beta [Syntrophales bacterium]|jgi:indolepyruvate ferredoxin oxidoreductase beta subunit|nr:indolepyruvate oxidoreductase subunit beta [Syntrophales bacterium]